MCGSERAQDTLRQTLQAVRRRLESADISMPELEAAELVACALGIDRRHIPALPGRPVTAAERERLSALLARRLAGEPLAYLLGEWDFYGITLRVTPDVLIPRSDTERLCELAIQTARPQPAPRVLDLCSGSGCIGLALLHEVPQARAVAVDISPAALAVAGENAERLGLADRYQCMQASALEPPAEAYRDTFDLMVCNPPYITADEMRTLDPDVADYEPHLALYGGEDGLDFYRAVTRAWVQAVRPGGAIFFECGWKQGEAVAAVCRAAGLDAVRVETDYAGVPRIVCAVRPG